MLKVIILATK